MAQQNQPHVDEAVQLRTVEDALKRRFAGRVPDETIAREVDEGLREFTGARVRTFIPVLLQKRVIERLRHVHPA
ncbi:MAG: hypothetical protein QOJ79_1016 [Actinomycetota bacterium]|jgi:hypothetical protein|nr:hypothetical protein [Actinomycetota bacterium]